MSLVACDIGGTHARFCVATVGAGSSVQLGEPITLKTADHPSFADALRAFAGRSSLDAISDLAIAFAGPLGGDVLKLTNSAWAIRRDELRQKLGIERLTIVNDFGAVGHAVATLPSDAFRHLCGPDAPLPDDGVTSIIGPGTGLGVAMLLRAPDGAYRVIEAEGGHIAFAPVDEVEDRILADLRARFGRVSVERLVSGRGLANIHAVLAGAAPAEDQRKLWASAIDGSDTLTAAALDRLCLVLGSVAGDLALAQGAKAVVIAGGLGQRLIDRLPQSGFGERFVAKGRFAAYMQRIPVKLVTHPEPGLLGAAAAFAQEHC